MCVVEKVEKCGIEASISTQDVMQTSWARGQATHT